MVPTTTLEGLVLAELVDKVDKVLETLTAVRVDVGSLIERSKNQDAAITAVRTKHDLDMIEVRSRLAVLEAWRWKLVGVGTVMGGGIGAFSAWVVNEMLGKV